MNRRQEENGQKEKAGREWTGGEGRREWTGEGEGWKRMETFEGSRRTGGTGSVEVDLLVRRWCQVRVVAQCPPPINVSADAISVRHIGAGRPPRDVLRWQRTQSGPINPARPQVAR